MNDHELVALRCAAVVLRKGAVLLCRRLGTESWILPGGTPRPGEGAAACARREVMEETGVSIDTERVAFVLEATSPDAAEHLIEVVFLGSDRDPASATVQNEPGLRPEFVPLEQLSQLLLRPPIGGYIRGLARAASQSLGAVSETAPYLGNVWRPGPAQDRTALSTSGSLPDGEAPTGR